MSDTCTVLGGGILILHDGCQYPIAVELGFNSHEPMAVVMTMTAHSEDMTDSRTWRYARDLLDQALSAPDAQIGQGDVSALFIAHQDVIRLTLIDAERLTHYVYFDAEPTRRFMAASLMLTPAHEEEQVHLAIDDELDRLLDGTWEL